MKFNADKKYVRIESVVLVEIGERETLEDAEDKFLNCLPEGIDCVHFSSEMWVDED